MLTVETGEGLSNAESFVSVADFKTYCDKIGYDYSSYTDSKIEQSLRRGGTHLTIAWKWQGLPSGGLDQALAFPRTGVYNADGYAVPSDSVPPEVIDANCELGFYDLPSPGSLTPVVTLAGQVKRSKVGSLEKELFSPSTNAGASVPILTVVSNLISGLLDASANNQITAKAVRV